MTDWQQKNENECNKSLWVIDYANFQRFTTNAPKRNIKNEGLNQKNIAGLTTKTRRKQSLDWLPSSIIEIIPITGK